MLSNLETCTDKTLETVLMLSVCIYVSVCVVECFMLVGSKERVRVKFTVRVMPKSEEWRVGVVLEVVCGKV